MDDETKPMPSDHADMLRLQLGKIAKLVPALDSWEYSKREPALYTEHPEAASAARALIYGAYELRKALFALEHLAHQIVEEHEQQQDERMTHFFGPE